MWGALEMERKTMNAKKQKPNDMPGYLRRESVPVSASQDNIRGPRVESHAVVWWDSSDEWDTPLVIQRDEE